jgi:hypothetical protein
LYIAHCWKQKSESPFKDPKSFAALSAALEGVGVSAYAGAAQLVSDKKLLTAAATILSTEARHTSWTRSAVNKGSGWSGAFDVSHSSSCTKRTCLDGWLPPVVQVALSLNQVFSLAAPFIDKCPPTNPPLPVTAFPPLKFSTSNPGAVATLTVAPPAKLAGPLYVAFLSGLDTTFVPVKDGGKVAIPAALRGVVYAVLTKKKDSVKDEDTVAGPAILDIEFDSEGRLRLQ